mgnify:CR=1 FL=1
MGLLIHHPISPFSRKVRILLSEKRVLFVLKEEEPWHLSPEALRFNPAGELPIFVYDGNVICGNNAICEFLNEFYHPKEIPLIGGDCKQRAEIRRLNEWFDTKFYREVYKTIVNEKVFKRFTSGIAPDSKILKSGLYNLNFHMEYLDWLCENRNFLAGDNFSLADIAAAAHLSVIDYLGDIPWEGYKNAKIWYSKVKSRPSFKEILKDNIKGILPSKHYSNLDF